MIAPARHQITITDNSTSPAQTYRTWDDWKLIPSSIPYVEPPEVKTSYIDIPGFSKRYDFTDALQGSTPYGNHEGDWQFYRLMKTVDMEDFRYNLVKAIHGKRLTIKLADSAVTYTGRLTVTGWNPHSGADYPSVDVTIHYDLDPPQKGDNV